MTNHVKKITVRQFHTFQGDKWFAPDSWNEYVEKLIQEGHEVTNVKLEKHWSSYDYPNAGLPEKQDYAIISYDITREVPA